MFWVSRFGMLGPSSTYVLRTLGSSFRLYSSTLLSGVWNHIYGLKGTESCNPAHLIAYNKIPGHETAGLRHALALDAGFVYWLVKHYLEEEVRIRYQLRVNYIAANCPLVPGQEAICFHQILSDQKADGRFIADFMSSNKSK